MTPRENERRVLLCIVVASDVFAMLAARCTGHPSEAFGVPVIERAELEPGTYVQQIAMVDEGRAVAVPGAIL